jgi:sarcosine oxidase
LQRSEFVIIGAGVMGSATANCLAAGGATVTIVDKYAQGHTRGGSHGDSRIFRVAYPDRDYAELAQESLRLWRELEAESDTQLLITTGGIDHGIGAVSAIGGVLERLRAPVEVLGPHEAMGRWPGMHFESEVVFQPDAGRLHADNAVRALQDQAERCGATLLFDSPAAISKETDTSVVVTTPTGDIEAGIVIVAAGAWAPALVPQLEIPPLRVTHEEPEYFAGGAECQRWPVFVHWGDTPGATFASYGMSVPGRGVKVGMHGTGEIIDPDSAERPTGGRTADLLREYVGSWLPGLAPSATDTVSCIYDTTPNEDFVIDRRGRVVVATGFSGHGFKFAPLIGQLVAQLAHGHSDSPPRFRFRRR